MAQQVNRSVNRQIRPISDRRQYGTSEHWTLPSTSRGDCEDIALLKKRELIRRGVPAEHLLLATVFSRRTGAHAILILRLQDGDYVLDNVEPRIKHWRQTGYNFMRMQNPRAPSSWILVSTH